MRTPRKKYWRHWCKYSKGCGVNPFLRSVGGLKRDTIVGSYASRVRRGCYGKGTQIKVQTVMDALLSISKTIELVGECSPRNLQGPKRTNKYKGTLTNDQRFSKGRFPARASVSCTAISSKLIFWCSIQKWITKGKVSRKSGYYCVLLSFICQWVYKAEIFLLKWSAQTSNMHQTIPSWWHWFFQNGKIIPRSSSLDTLLMLDNYK